ncbi:hypothetical protein D3C81_966880 [compost metagenome]
MRRQTLAHVLAQLFGQLGGGAVLRAEHDERLDQFGALRIGLADHGGLDHGRVFDQRTFHVERANPVAGGGDHVIAATDEADAAVRVPLDGVATQVIVADKGLGRPAFVAGEPAHRRLAAVDSQDARLPNAEFLVLVIQHHNAVARRGKTGGAHVNRVLQAVVVAQHHAQLGLAVVVVDDHAEVVGEPADHFRVQRLAGAADDAQLALDRPGEFIATGDQQAIRRR